MDLQEPTKKMSTTGGTAQGTVGVLDPPDDDPQEVQERGHRLRLARCATTPTRRPGISNLIEIMSIATGEEIPAIEARYDGGGYGTFKADVGEAVVALLDPIRRRYEELRTDPAELERLLGARRRQGPRGLGPDARADVRAHGLRPALDRVREHVVLEHRCTALHCIAASPEDPTAVEVFATQAPGETNEGGRMKGRVRIAGRALVVGIAAAAVLGATTTHRTAAQPRRAAAASSAPASSATARSSTSSTSSSTTCTSCGTTRTSRRTSSRCRTC